MTNYMIFIRSNEHPRTINSFRNSRCFYTMFEVRGIEACKAKVAELRANGEKVTSIRTNNGSYVWF